MKFHYNFYNNENQIKKNTLHKKNNSNSFSVKLKYPEIIVYNNNLFNFKKNYFNINNIKIYPEKSLSRNTEINSYSNTSIYNKTFNEKNIEQKIENKNKKGKKKINENVNKIIKILLSDKFDENKFLKPKINLKNIINNQNKNKEIDPKYYIKNKFQIQPNNKNLFKTYIKQIKALGSEKYRNSLFKEINEFEIKTLKYSFLKGPTGINLKPKENKINKDIKNLILDMEQNSFSPINNNIRKRNNYPFLKKYHTDNKIKLNSKDIINEKINKSLFKAEKTLNHFNKREKEYEKIRKKMLNY